MVVLVDEHDRRRAQVVLQASPAIAEEKRPTLVMLLEQLGVAAGIATIERIPLTPTGKPDRMRLRRLLGTRHTGMESIIHLKDLT